MALSVALKERVQTVTVSVIDRGEATQRLRKLHAKGAQALLLTLFIKVTKNISPSFDQILLRPAKSIYGNFD